MSAAKLLDRLGRVRPTRPGQWIACCPAHDDRTPSLSIRELDNGRVLLYDFGGCETGDVLAAVGLRMHDLFDRPLGHRFAPSKSQIPARDLLEIISEETSLVAILASSFLEKRCLNGGEWTRLARAAARIGRARDHACEYR